MGAVKDQLMEVEQFVIDQSCDDITNDEIIAVQRKPLVHTSVLMQVRLSMN